MPQDARDDVIGHVDESKRMEREWTAQGQGRSRTPTRGRIPEPGAAVFVFRRRGTRVRGRAIAWCSDGSGGEADLRKTLPLKADTSTRRIALLHRGVARDESLEQNILQIPDPEWGQTELVLWNHPGDDLFGAIARCARIVSAMELLLGGEVYHYHSKLIAKQPRTGGGFHWHQDFGYWYENGILFPDLASVMIAVDRMTVENGCLQILKGSHHMGRVTHIDVGGQRSADPERVEEAMKVLEHVHCEMEPGDCLFTHCNTLHASAPNESDKPRTALLCCYNAARNNPFRAHHHAEYTPLESCRTGSQGGGSAAGAGAPTDADAVKSTRLRARRPSDGPAAGRCSRIPGAWG